MIYTIAYILIGIEDIPKLDWKNVNFHYYYYPIDTNWDELRLEVKDLADFYDGILVKSAAAHIPNLVPRDKDVGGYEWGQGPAPVDAVVNNGIVEIDNEYATITCKIKSKKQLTFEELVMERMKNKHEKYLDTEC